MILITGSSGYVASNLIPKMKSISQVRGIDFTPSKYTDILAGIETVELKNALKELACEEVSIINLAAARFDFGATAKQYFYLNVRCHELFLDALSQFNVKKFIHVSSVAAFDGSQITYSEELKCDDAYRSTKYLQEVLIKEWCQENGVDLTILYPSAIFSGGARSDTNIGKMQILSKYLPFVPKIDVHKSLTYLPKFSSFIVDVMIEKLPSGQYLAFEKPTLGVSEMIRILSGRSIPIINIPGLRVLLKIIARLLFIIGAFGRIDMKLTPNRVTKLFSDTSYNNLNDDKVDQDFYTINYGESLIDILEKFKNKK